MPKRRVEKRWDAPPETLAPLVTFLGSLQVFAEATETDLRRLAVAAEDRVYPPGTDVIREMRIPTHFYAVRTGVLEVWSRGESEEPRKLNTLKEGDHFGEIGLIEGMPSTATVSTATSCELVRIPAADFLGVLSESPALIQPLLQRVAGALARSHPSYRLATEDLVERPTGDLLEALRSRLAQLSPDERARFIAEVREVIDEQGSAG